MFCSKSFHSLLTFYAFRSAASDVAYQNRKDSGRIVLRYTGKNFNGGGNEASKTETLRKAHLEKMYADDFKNLVQYGTEKETEQTEGGNSHAFDI